MKEPRRVLLKAYVRPALKARIAEHSKRTGLSVSKIAERILETGRMPDLSTEKAVLNLLAVNADQARLGNLLLKAINETADGHTVRDMQSLLKDVRKTQAEIKAQIARIHP
ncbi:conjugal transfer protein TraJ [Rhodobacterales bacterium]|nr:conjugal transfer protein TraJ [Rhodobacterales bacterium]